MSSNYILARSKDEAILKKAAVGGAVTGNFTIFIRQQHYRRRFNIKT